MNERILVVDDEKEIADLVTVYLENEGYEVYCYYTAKEALACIQNEILDMAILDVMLPEIDGFTLCKEIRKKEHYPVIMLTAKGEDMDKITGLAIGADDYMTKPFNPLELVARVKAQLRRYTRYNEGKEETRLIDFSGLVIDQQTHEVILYDKKIDLTPLEYQILLYLCENRGRVVPSKELFEKVWKEIYVDSNTIMVHIRRIREKMGEKPKNPTFIKTIWGVGYTIEK